MRRVYFWFVFLVLIVPAVAAVTNYLPNEKIYGFTAENLSQTIPDFVTDEKKQGQVADAWQRLMDPETGMVSIADLFEICRTAGFNTYKVAGYNQCRDFIVKLLENAETQLEEGALGGFCPGLDENGKNPNKLSSITDKTRVGDFCSSTNIAGGEVVFKKGYNCTCVAYACNDGFESKGGACVTRVADANGNCLRQEYTNVTEVSQPGAALKFCESKAQRGCKVINAIRNFNSVKGMVVCNATPAEFAAVKSAEEARKAADEAKKIANLKYYEVCGKDKGKTGKKEYCVEKFFNWTNVGMVEADGLARLYAVAKHGNTIYCSTSYRTSWNDDYIKCTNKDNTVFYEFQFDDVKESIDADKAVSVGNGIKLIYGYKSGPCTENIKKGAKWFGGYEAQTVGNYCIIKQNVIAAKDADSKLRDLNGKIDCYAFYHGIQIQANSDLKTQLKAYVQSKGVAVKTFTCDSGYGRIKNKFYQGDDDILTCYVDGKPVDFVFDDVSEAFKYKQEAGQAGIQCIVMGGKYQGAKCHGLSREDCIKADKALKAKFPDIDGTKWENGQCVLKDAADEKKYDIAVNVGVGLVSAVDCAVLTHTGCAILAVELAGLATEITTDIAMAGRAEDFLKESVKCKARSCAKNTIKTLGGRVLSVKGGLSDKDLHAVDEEFARLVEYLEPEDLSSDVSSADWDNIVTQLGGDPNDTSGQALVIANKIGLVAQFASIGVSTLRLTGKAIAKVVAKSSVKTGVAGTKALAVAGSHADDAGRALAVAGSHADDAGRALAVTGGHADDAGRALAVTGSHVDDAGRALMKPGTHVDDVARQAEEAARHATKEVANATGKTTNVAETANKAGNIVYDAAYFSKGSSAVDDVFKHADDVVQISRQNMPASVLRDVMKKAEAHGFSCTDCGGDVLKFTKKVEAGKVVNEAANTTKALTVETSRMDDAARLANAADESYDAAATFSKQFSGDFASIGVKEERTAAGGFRYRDTKTGRFVSRQDILERVYGKPNVRARNLESEVLDIGTHGYTAIGANVDVSPQ